MKSNSLLTSLKRAARERLLRRWGFEEQILYGRSSFSQEGEDILLRRILATDTSPGTYIDVGANHPFFMSNTASLYQAGWSGIAIEPNPDFAKPFLDLRPNDIFVNCGVAMKESKSTYYRFEEPLFNTFDPEQAERARKHSNVIEQISVAVAPLRSILDKSWPVGKTIRLMSIDCEGFDTEVVQSHDFEKYPVEFIYAELDSPSLTTLQSSTVYQEILSHGFVAIAKLWKSALFIHKDAAITRGLEV